MSEASDRWNALPIEERKRLAGVLIERQILDYRIEIERAKRAHRKHMTEIKSHLANCERSYEQWLKETE